MCNVGLGHAVRLCAMTDDWFDPPLPGALAGTEAFAGLDATVNDFWSFAMSDLRMNNVRGYLAEFLVAKAVGATGRRVEWDAYDVLSPEGVRIEVKTSGYMQSWRQRAPSRISFTVKRAHTWSPELGESAEKSLNADVYVFALQSAGDHDSYDALDVNQWTFYVAPLEDLESAGMETFSLATLERLGVEAVAFAELAARIRTAAGN